MAENASANGAVFRFNSRVEHVERVGENYRIRLLTSEGETREIEARAVVNAAGVFADTLHNMVSSRPLSITPRRGQYFLLDKSAGSHVSHTIFQLPGKLGKGVLVTPTVHGNLLVGPTAENIEAVSDTHLDVYKRQTHTTSRVK